MQKPTQQNDLCLSTIMHMVSSKTLVRKELTYACILKLRGWITLNWGMVIWSLHGVRFLVNAAQNRWQTPSKAKILNETDSQEIP